MRTTSNAIRDAQPAQPAEHFFQDCGAPSEKAQRDYFEYLNSVGRLEPSGQKALAKMRGEVPADDNGE